MPRYTVEAVDRARSSSGQSTGLRGQCSPGLAPKQKCRICGDRGHGATRCPLAIAATAHPASVPAPELARIRMERALAEARRELRRVGLPEADIRWALS